MFQWGVVDDISLRTGLPLRQGIREPGLMDEVVRWKPADMAGLTGNSPETTEYTDTGMTPAS